MSRLGEHQGAAVESIANAAHARLVQLPKHRRHVIAPRRDEARQLLDRAMDRKEIPADTETEVALDLVYGPLYHRLLHGHAPLSDAFVEQAVDLALTGIIGTGLS